MTFTEHQWYVNAVQDRYRYLSLSNEQAEKIHRYEQEKDTYSDKHYFSVWEEWDYELTTFKDILNEEQFGKYQAFLDETVQRYERSLIEEDNQEPNEVAYLEDLLNFYEQQFIPDFFTGPFLGLFWLPTDHVKLDYWRAEYKQFLNDTKKEILTSHFRHNRRLRPNQLKISLMRHKVSYIFPDYNLFKHRMDEPTKAVALYLKIKVMQLPEETEKLVTQKFQELSEFREANFKKHYGNDQGWHVAFGSYIPEEEKEHRLMTLTLLDKRKYGC